MDKSEKQDDNQPLQEACIPLTPTNSSPAPLPPALPLSAYVKSLLLLAWPISIATLTGPIHCVISLYFVGRLDHVQYVDAVSLGTSWLGIFGFSIQLGLAGGLDTLVSQSFGKKEFSACGLFLNRAFVIVSAASCGCAALMCVSGPVFRLFGIDGEVAAEAQNYTLGMVPVVALNVPWVLLERFLYLQGVVHPQMVIQVVNTALYPVYCYVFFDLMGMGYMGAAAAKVFSELFYVSILVIYLKYTGCRSESFVPFDKSAFAGWREYLALGVPTLLMRCLEWWAWEVLNLVCGTLGVAELAANSTLFNVGMFLYIFSSGLSGASSTLVGRSLGEGSARLAKSYAAVGTMLTVAGTALSCLTMFCVRGSIERIFTNDPEVIRILDGLMYLYLIEQMFDTKARPPSPTSFAITQS